MRAAAAYGDGTRCEIFDPEDRIVIVARHQIVIDVVERERHRHARGARQRLDWQRRRRNVGVASFQNLEQ